MTYQIVKIYSNGNRARCQGPFETTEEAEEMLQVIMTGKEDVNEFGETFFTVNGAEYRIEELV
jgi:hypothetical protein